MNPNILETTSYIDGMWPEKGAAEKENEKKATSESCIFQFNSSLLLTLYFNMYLTSQAFIFSGKACIKTEIDERLELILKDTGTILTYE